MKQEQSIASLIHAVRNQLQPFWTLVDMVRIPIEGDIVEQAEIAYKQGSVIIAALEKVVEIAEKRCYTEEDLEESFMQGICTRCPWNDEQDEEDQRKYKEWITHYNKQKQNGNTNK